MPCPDCGCEPPASSPWEIVAWILIFVFAVLGVLFVGLETAAYFSLVLVS